MADTTTITVRLDKAVKERLEALAESTRRSKSFLAAEAIGQYVDLNAWQIEQIEEAVARADQGGPFLSQDDVNEYFRRRAQGERAARPRATKD